MTCIVGSGLSAAAAAVAFVRQGCCPTVLDTGLTPDPAAQKLKERLSALEPEDWREEDVEPLRRIGPNAANGIPRKLHFGSDHTFSEVDLAAPLELCGASMHRSFAMGGFSNVWGTVIQPFSTKELEGRPIAAVDLAPHYAAVRALLCDLREETSPEISFLSEASEPALRPSSQAYALYSDLKANSRALKAEGIRFDYACLAVRRFDKNGQQACRYCGMCLYGCPYGCTYTAGSTLTRLAREGLIHYVPGMIVDKLIAKEGQVLIETRSLSDGTKQTFYASHVLLAAGLLETARIILVSLGLYNTPLRIRQSDIFTLPLLRYGTAGDVFFEKLHTLCQLVAEIEDNSICEQPVHLQFYGYNDLYLKLLTQKMIMGVPHITPLLRTVVARLFMIFGYLHSSVSSGIELQLSNNGRRRLFIRGVRNPAADQIVRKVARKLFSNRGSFRGIPLFFLARLDLPGEAITAEAHSR